ncbi:MAG TPA: L,D-transpeptidase family protein [Gaiellaceae bacterium]|nr:L,D-transpeptidase family protein [Gaiellaceae bacterium]
MRRVVAIGFLALALPAAAHAQTLTLDAAPASTKFGGTVTFSGTLTPATEGVAVAVFSLAPGVSLVGQTTVAADGSWSVPAALTRPGPYLARAQLDATTTVDSPQLVVPLKPRLTAEVVGKRTVGARVVLRGRMQPAAAGRLTLRFAGKARRVRVGGVGRFQVTLPTDVPGRFRWSLRVAPKPGYLAARRANTLVLTAPPLALGARGQAVLALERRLNRLRYALATVNSTYGYDTVEAVFALQKVHGLPRTGRVGAQEWRLLRTSGVPRARVPRGDHIEVSKTTQVMYEVRDGKVVKVVHVSTGATGNTPVGKFRVYLLTPGTLPSGMYYSLFFLRGFAIHGYPSVPTYPASHGCVRTPMWFAPGFYRRWGKIGTVIHVFA